MSRRSRERTSSMRPELPATRIAHSQSLLRAPNDASASNEEMAAATLLPPNRRVQGHDSGRIPRQAPARSGIREQAQMHDLAAATWAYHRRAPNVLRLADQVDRAPV